MNRKTYRILIVMMLFFSLTAALAQTQTVTEADGSVIVTTTDETGKILTRIHYDAAENMTTKIVYGYDELGRLLNERNYAATGNAVDALAAGDHSSLVGEGFINYSDRYMEDAVDAENAFVPTIEAFTPLYGKAEEISNTYGVLVLIADKITDRSNGAKQCLEYERTENCLRMIENCLSCYPADFFRDFSGTLCIQLVGTGAAAGHYSGGYEYLLIQVDANCYHPGTDFDEEGSFFCGTLHHEIGHAIDFQLRDKAFASECPLTEEKWNSYNSEGFEYVNSYDGEAQAALYTSGNNSLYFLDSYGCAFPTEDRADLFSRAMQFCQGYNVERLNDRLNAKLRYFSDCIRAGFQSGHWGSVAPWEKIMN